MLTLLPGNCKELESACWPFLLVTALNLDGTASAQTFFLLMEDGNKVVLFYLSNALIQDIPFWPLFVLATAAQQQEEKNGTTSVILFIYFLISFAGKAWTASRTWTHGYNERNIIFSSPCILTLLPGSLKKISRTLVVPSLWSCLWCEGLFSGFSSHNMLSKDLWYMQRPGCL